MLVTLLETEECHAGSQNGTVNRSIISLANPLTFVQSVTLHTTLGDLKVCLYGIPFTYPEILMPFR